MLQVLAYAQAGRTHAIAEVLNERPPFLSEVAFEVVAIGHPSQIVQSLVVPKRSVKAADSSSDVAVECDELLMTYGEPDTPLEITTRSAEYVEPVSDTERRLASIWREILHVERVGRHDNFFEVGEIGRAHV